MASSMIFNVAFVGLIVSTFDGFGVDAERDGDFGIDWSYKELVGVDLLRLRKEKFCRAASFCYYESLQPCLFIFYNNSSE